MRKPRLKSTARKATAMTKGAVAKVPGPSSNAATNLLIIDVAMRGASMVFWRAMEKALLRARYNREKAADIVQGRSMIQSAAATGAARLASRSFPGFLLVTGGLLAKVVFDRSLRPHDARRRGEQQFAEQAANAEDESNA